MFQQVCIWFLCLENIALLIYVIIKCICNYYKMIQEEIERINQEDNRILAESYINYLDRVEKLNEIEWKLIREKWDERYIEGIKEDLKKVDNVEEYVIELISIYHDIFNKYHDYGIAAPYDEVEPILDKYKKK